MNTIPDLEAIFEKDTFKGEDLPQACSNGDFFWRRRERRARFSRSEGLVGWEKA